VVVEHGQPLLAKKPAPVADAEIGLEKPRASIA
jgi:hypothetical protein